MKMSDWRKYFDTQADAAESADRRRKLRFWSPDGPVHLRSEKKRYLHFASNDYLGLAFEPAIIQAFNEAAQLEGAGATASRLLVGSREIHARLETALAEMKGSDRCLVFPSGYQCAISTLQALLEKGDLVALDAEAHASLLDGAQLSGAAFTRFRHNSPETLEKILIRRARPGRKTLAVIESVYSMSGDLAPVERFARVCEKYGAGLLVDEAHATGVFGYSGEGLCGNLSGRIDPDRLMVMGTLSKAIGSQGGFLCASKACIEHLVQRARGFIFTTGLSPASAAAALKAVELLPELGDRRKKLQRLGNALRDGVGERIPEPHSQIIPVVFGSEKAALAASAALECEGIIVPAIRPPTVKPGASRLRVSLSSAHSFEDVKKLAELLAKLLD